MKKIILKKLNKCDGWFKDVGGLRVEVNNVGLIIFDLKGCGDHIQVFNKDVKLLRDLFNFLLSEQRKNEKLLG